MQLGCTKKLLDIIGMKSQPINENNDFYTWSAHVKTLNRRKAVIVVNDLSRFGFVLYGLKAKEFKQLDKLILQGIRTCLTSLRIKERVIEQYIKKAGNIQFSKTKGPKYVARLNKACERVGFFREEMDVNIIYQTVATKYLNSDLIKINKSDYEHPYQLIIKDFKQVYDDLIIQCTAMDIVIKLDLGAYSATRRLIIPADINFKQLHEIIQIAFGWKNYHLHDFMLYNENSECVLNIISEIEMITELADMYEIAIDSEVKITDYLKTAQKIVYRYDFGDNWEHEIKLMGENHQYDKNFPQCVMAEGDAPPEDVGGIPGYEEFRAIMSNPNHLDYQSMKRWADSQWYKEFDLDLINRQLKHVLWKIV